MRGEALKRTIFLLMTLIVAGSAFSEPSRIVLLRHGEKENAYALCDVGQRRSLALRAQYLGKGAEKSLFDQAPPAAFFATTLHTLELAAPAADSWGLPITTYAVVPLKGQDDAVTTAWLTRQTRRAAADVMANPRWQGQTVVMVWEHKHIANEKLLKHNPDELVDLRQLLKLDQLPKPYRYQVPAAWSGANYNMFWVIDYDALGRPVAFQQIRQTFSGEFADLPDNDWGVAESLPSNTRCKRWE